MSTQLPIQLSEAAFSALSEHALAAGKTPAELAASVVESVFAGRRCHPVDSQAARAEFERCFGSVDVGRPIGVSNDAIDADLAREYGPANGSK